MYIICGPLAADSETTSELWWLSEGEEGILSELLCAGLCDAMLTVSSTLIWAVFTGPANWTCHIGTLILCIEAVAWSCIFVTWWSGSGWIKTWSRRPTGFLQCFDTVGFVIWPVKIVPKMTYNVLSGTLSYYIICELSDSDRKSWMSVELPAVNVFTKFDITPVSWTHSQKKSKPTMP